MRQLVPVALLLSLVACGGSDGSPTAPSGPSATRIIALTGDLTFGPVSVGATSERPFRIANSGTEALTVTGMTGPSGYSATWTSGTIPPGGSQDVIVRFSPTEPKSYDGRLTVNGNHTSGINTIAVFGNGDSPPWRMTGSGNTVFDMPTRVSRVRIIATYTGFSSNFIVRVSGRLEVNELMGTGWNLTRYEGVHLVSGGITEITNSTGVAWSFEEVR